MDTAYDQRWLEQPYDEEAKMAEADRIKRAELHQMYEGDAEELAQAYPGDHVKLAEEWFAAMRAYRTGHLTCEQLADRLTNITGQAIDETVEHYL